MRRLKKDLVKQKDSTKSLEKHKNLSVWIFSWSVMQCDSAVLRWTYNTNTSTNKFKPAFPVIPMSFLVIFGALSQPDW